MRDRIMIITVCSIVVIGVLSVTAASLLPMGGTSAEAMSLADLSAAAERQREDIMEELRQGGTFTLTREVYRRNREYPTDVVPESLRHPDRVVNRTSVIVDSTGTVVEQFTDVLSTEGELLARSQYVDGALKTEAPNGDSYELPKGFVEYEFSDWLTETLGTTSRLKEGGYVVAGTGSLDGSTSTVLEGEFDLEQQGPDAIRRVFEFNNEAPLRFRSALYEIDGSEETLTRESRVVAIEIEPTDGE